MNVIKLLKARLEELQPLFNVETDKENKARDEKLRLQGEHRLISNIIKSTEKKEAK